ncbi:MAG TPA: alpha/beta fold hydrolase [Patescibacteria group bacterium]|nr:alpha/beta fold hydrolase [Patescibacteria group bacterium]
MENSHIENDGFKLATTLFVPKDAKEKNPAILFIPGWTGQRVRNIQYAESLVKLGYICFLVDLRGHGESEGDINQVTHEQLFSDVLKAYDHLAKLDGVDPDNISAIGSSMGGYLVAILASKRKLKNIVLRVPANYPRDTFTKLARLVGSDNPGVLEWRMEKREPKDTLALESIHNFDGNILILESEFDESVPQPTLHNFRDAVKDPSKLTYHVLKGAPHSIKEGKFRDMVDHEYTDWFSKLF